MLRSLQNKLSNKSLFFKEIVIFVTALHVVVAAVFFLFGFQHHYTKRFSVRGQSQLTSTIVFMPLQKYVDPEMNKGRKTSSMKKHQSHKVIDYQSYLKKQGYNVVSGKAEKPEKKKPKTALKKQKKEQVKSVQKKSVASKIKKKKTAHKKEVKKKVAKKIVDKKVTKKKLVQKKEITKKVEVQNKVEKASKPVKAQAVEEVKQVGQQRAPEVVSEKVDLEDVTFVGYRELDTLQLQSKIQQAVEMYWSPPAGMPKSTVCELQIRVGQKGKVSGATVAKSSRIRVFDIAARSAIYKTKFPKEVWGKQIMVELGI